MTCPASLCRVLALMTLVSAFATGASAQTETVPGSLIAYSTIYSIGLEWDIVNDSDHDAAAEVEYRASDGEWKIGLPLVRVDYNGRNMLAGSVLFLSPDTSYTVRVSLVDPDGGGETREVTVRTRAVPVAPSGGRVLHVVPGAGGGDGTPASPFRGVPAAEAVAQPGDTFLLHAGDYGGRISLSAPGTPAALIAWRAAGDGEVAMAGVDIYSSFVWLEGITIRDQFYATRTGGAPTGVVVTRCRFFNNHYSIFLSSGGSNWYIADNTIVGDTPNVSESDEGEGIELNMTNGHTVAHNSITNVADGISYPRMNVDIFGNDIFDTSDDGIELDFGLANVRVWGNRVHNAFHNGVSFQPQNGGPWYIIRNQIAGIAESPFKFRTTDRFVLLHNTIVNWGGYMICCNPGHLLRSFSRNNLWISAQGGQMWAFEAGGDWRTDLDYDGFDWGTGAYPFWYAGTIYYDLASFASAAGVEPHGIRVFKDGCFQDFRVSGPTPAPIPPHVMTLQPSCNAVDAGVVLPNINDGFAGGAPDLGAHEYGQPAAVYGPRTSNIAPSVSITSPLSGAIFTAPATVSIAAAASDADGSIAGVEFHVDGAPISSDAVSPYATTWSNVPPGVYSVTAWAIDNAGAVSGSNAVTVIVNGGGPPPSSSLPDPWSRQDLGSTAVAGSASEDAGTFTVSASGRDIWGSADAFGFAYRPLAGDGTIVARVASLQNTDVWAKAGVMLRETLSADSAHAFMFVTPDGGNGLAFQRRVTAGGATTHTGGGSGSAPAWVRLTRTGATITASRSSDGVTWNTVGSDTIAMAATIYVGLAVTSHADGVLGTATFDSVDVSRSSPAPGAGLPAGWASQDVGSVGASGSVDVSDGAWTVRASGADVWGTADAFRFTYRALAGDGAIVARVAAIDDSHPWAKGGVMMRGGLSAAAPHAFVFATPGGANGLAFQRRVSEGAATVHTAAGGGTAPVWVMLSRVGSAITASRSPDGVSWTEVGTDTVPMGATIYVGVAATSHVDGVLGSVLFDHVTVVEATGRWNSRDIGTVGAPGNATVAGSAATVTGSGTDIWGTSDAFQYAYTTVTGDFSITARVTAVDNVDRWTKAGVMIRATEAADSVHASLFATPTTVKGIAFQRRVTSGGESVHTAGPPATPAVWLRLTRQGGTIAAAYRQSSADAWTPIGSESIPDLSATVLVGLAVTSHSDGALATATFDNVSVVGE